MQIKVRTILLICLILLSSCKTKSYREKFSHYFNLTDQLNFIESNVVNSNKIKFSINIRFGHNSIKFLNSELSVSKDSVKIKSIRETNFQVTVDTIFNVSKNQFLKEMEFQRTNAKDIIVLAGHYQTIMISKNDKSIQYPTTRAGRYLIEFLEEGKLHFLENNLPKTANSN